MKKKMKGKLSNYTFKIKNATMEIFIGFNATEIFDNHHTLNPTIF